MYLRLKKYLTKRLSTKEVFTLNEVFKPLYKVLLLFGLFPYNIKYQSNQHNFLILHKTIYFNAVCAVSINLIIYLFVTFHIQYIYMSMEDNNLATGIMPNLNYITELLCLVLFCIVTYFNAFSNGYRYVKILNTLAQLLDSSEFNRKILVPLKFDITIVVLGSLLFSLLLQIIVNFTRDDSFYKMILVLLTFNLPQMIQFTSIAFYCVLVNMVVAALINIRLRLCNFMKRTEHNKAFLISVESKLPSISLRQLEINYIKALEVKKEVNNAFQAPILITMVQSFHSMVSESHIIYHGMILEKSLSTHEILNCSIWILYQLIKVYALARSGKLLKSEIMRLGQALFTMPTEKYDIKLFMEVQHFSSLIYYQGRDLTAYGFFPLDATLMFKVVSSATMYLIILVQFDKK